MSLKIWFPLNGSLENKGLTNISPAAAGLTYTSSGKTTPQCSYFNSSHINIPNTSSILTTDSHFSIAFWAKLSDTKGGYYTLFCDRTVVGKGLSIFYNPSGGGFRFDTGDSQTWFSAETSYVSWTHFCFTFDGNEKCLYINGTKNKTIINYTGQLTNIGNSILIGKEVITNPSHPILTSYLNDYRIYDHCLSPREVKLLSQGLIAHYKLDGNEIENPNLVNGSYGDVTSTEYMLHRYTFDKAGFGRYLTEGEKCTLTVCFTPGSNFSYFNPHINNGYMGGWMDNILANGTGKQIVTVTSSPSWKYSYTSGGTNYTDPNNAPSMADVCMFNKNTSGGNGSTGTIIHWIKLQLGEHPEAKTWTPSISEDPNQYLLEDDCSGYGNHGTCSVPFGLTSDTPRYKNCKNFENNKYIQTETDTTGQTDLTISAWINPTTFTNGDDNNCIVIGGAYLTINSVGKVYTYFYGKNKEGYHTSATTLPLNKWSHIAAVWNDSKKQHIIYINGESDLIVEDCYGAASTNHTYKYIGREKTWRSFNGKISDVRIYATALSAAAVKELYQSSISFLDNGTLQCSEIVELPTNLKFKENGITQAELISEIGYTNKMKIKTLSDGSAWARIHWLDVSSNPKNSNLYFTGGADEVTYCVNQSNRFSLMCYVDKFKTINNNYEFMLTYPKELSGYNRWTQTSSANSGSVSGLVKITTAWDSHNYGIRKNGSSSMYNCDTGGTWYASIGQYGIWDSTNNLYIPNANGTNSTEVELWVRIDNLPKLTKLSMLNGALQAHQIYEL